MKKTEEVRQQRAKLIADARAIHEKAEKEQRSMTSEENVQFDKMMGDAAEKLSEVQRTEKLDEAEKSLGERRGAPIVNPIDDGNKERRHFKFESRKNPDSTKQILLAGPTASKEFRSAYWKRAAATALKETPAELRLTDAEQRSMQMDIGTAGGYLVPPQEFIAQLIAGVDDQVFLRQFATVHTMTNAVSLGVPTRDTDVDDVDWTSELATGSESAGPTVGKRELTPHPAAKLIKLSKKLVRASAIDPEGLIRQRLQYKVGITQEKAFLLGTGVQQPLGVFTASSDGISTGRDVSTGSSTNFTADGLFDAKYKLKGQYWNRMQWLFHRDGMKLLAKLKNSTTNEYYLTPSLAGGTADTLLGRPVNVSEYVPNTFTSGLYVGMLADFSQYWIVDALSWELQVLNELYAATNQVGFIGRFECDGMPVLEEAFVRLKTA
jgi:HK97 family phage major capsid protein